MSIRNINDLFFGRNDDAKANIGSIPDSRFTGRRYKLSEAHAKHERDISPTHKRHKGKREEEKLTNAACLTLAYI